MGGGGGQVEAQQHDKHTFIIVGTVAAGKDEFVLQRGPADVLRATPNAKSPINASITTGDTLSIRHPQPTRRQRPRASSTNLALNNWQLRLDAITHLDPDEQHTIRTVIDGILIRHQARKLAS